MLQLPHDKCIVSDHSRLHAAAYHYCIGIIGLLQIDMGIDSQAIHGGNSLCGATNADFPIGITQQRNSAQHSVGNQGVKFIKSIKGKDCDMHRIFFRPLGSSPQ